MQKITFIFIISALSLLLVACKGSQIKQNKNQENPHPFAAALIEFFEEVPEDELWGNNDTISDMSAFLIDLDSNGTKGVIAYKGYGQGDFYRLIYLIDDVVQTMDFAGFWFYLFEIGDCPLVVLGGGEGAGKNYKIFSLMPDGLVVTSILWETVHGEFYYSPAGFVIFDDSHKVSENEFLSLLDLYGINDSRWLPFSRKPQEYRSAPAVHRPDDTAIILAMTMP